MLIEMPPDCPKKLKYKDADGFSQKSAKMAPPMTGMLPLRPHHNRRAMQWEQLDTS